MRFTVRRSSVSNCRKWTLPYSFLLTKLATPKEPEICICIVNSVAPLTCWSVGLSGEGASEAIRGQGEVRSTSFVGKPREVSTAQDFLECSYAAEVRNCKSLVCDGVLLSFQGCTVESRVVVFPGEGLWRANFHSRFS